MSASSTTDPNELKRLATRAVALKAIVDDATFKKKALRDALLRLQEALERRRIEEDRLRREAEEEERRAAAAEAARLRACLLYTSPSPRDKRQSRMPSSA